MRGKIETSGHHHSSHSILSYANAHRPWQLYQEIFLSLFAHIQSQVNGQKKIRLKNKLLALDSALIHLCLSFFDWVHFRRTKGANKPHLILDHDGYLPSYTCITEGNIANVKIAQKLQFDPGIVIAGNAVLNDYRFFGQWIAHGFYFVTRMKGNAQYKPVGDREIS